MLLLIAGRPCKASANEIEARELCCWNNFLLPWVVKKKLNRSLLTYILSRQHSYYHWFWGQKIRGKGDGELVGRKMKAVLELSNKACRASGSCVVCTKASLGDLCLAYHLLPLLGVCFNCFVDGRPRHGPFFCCRSFKKLWWTRCLGWNVNSISP